MLLGGAVLLIGGYSLSSGPMSWPGIHARYLIGLLIVTPAIIYPLWNTLSTIKTPLEGQTRLKIISASAALLVIVSLLLVGTVNTFREIPANQAKNQQQAALINDLLHMGATHIYTDYWTCDRIAFISNERIICAVLDPDLIGTHNNRYMPYLSMVESDPRAAYVFLVNSPQAATMAHQAAIPGVHYQRLLLDGYIVYKPV
jgi:hypothetical protein